MKHYKTDLIPKGEYCYTPLSYDGDKQKLKVKYCPYYTSIDIGGISLTHCLYCNETDLGNDLTDDKVDILTKHFNCSDNELFDMFPIDLLWDACKCCNVNIEDEE